MKYITSFLLTIGLMGSAICVDPFDIYGSEGFVAFVYNANVLDKTEEKVQPTKPCDCGGSGRTKTGDGINTTECPCGADCKCRKSTPALNKRILLFTNTKTCPPCRRFKNQSIPNLEKKNWKFGTEANNHCQIFEEGSEGFAEGFKKYNLSAMPSFVLIEGDKVIGTKVGFLTTREFADFYYGRN